MNIHNLIKQKFSELSESGWSWNYDVEYKMEKLAGERDVEHSYKKYLFTNKLSLDSCLVNTILDSPKLKEFADDNSKFDENGRMFCYRVKTLRKGEIACHKQSLLFQVFSKDLSCRQIKTRACLGKG